MKPNLHLVAALLITGSLVLVGRGTSAASALAQGSSSPAASPVRYGGCQAPHTYIKGDPHAELASQIPPPARPKKRYTIVVLMSNAGDPYFQNKSYGYITAARKWNVNVELYDAGGYENSTKQISQMEDAIQRHVNAIILTATNGAALVPGVNEAVQAHIPVVNDDVLVNSNKVNVKDSENSVNVGYHEAYYIACKMGGKGDVVMLKGPAGADIAIARVKGAMMAFRKFPGIHIVAQQWAPSNIVAATNLMDDFLQAHHNIGGVYSFGAVTALGAAQALKSAGYKPGTKRWPVIATIDLHAQSIAAMQQKEFQAVIPAEPVRLAETSVVLAMKLAEHQSVPKRVYTDSEIPLTLSNLKHFNMSLALAPKGWKPPIH